MGPGSFSSRTARRISHAILPASMGAFSAVPSLRLGTELPRLHFPRVRQEAQRRQMARLQDLVRLRTAAGQLISAGRSPVRARLMMKMILPAPRAATAENGA